MDIMAKKTTPVRLKKQAKANVAQLNLRRGCKTKSDGRSCHRLLLIPTAVLGNQLSSSRSTMNIKSKGSCCDHCECQQC